MKQIAITIKGVSPLLVHRFPEEPIEALEKKPPAEQARIALYEQDGKPFFPGVNIQRALVAAAAFSKGKGRASLQKQAAAGLIVEESQLSLDGAAYVVDSRAVTIPATKGRVMRHRPRFDQWSLRYTLTYDETLMSEEQVQRIVQDCGSRVGIGDFRPERKGPFGRFMVIEFKAL